MDDALAEHGLSRRVVARLPYVLVAAHALVGTDAIRRATLRSIALELRRPRCRARSSTQRALAEELDWMDASCWDYPASKRSHGDGQAASVTG